MIDAEEIVREAIRTHAARRALVQAAAELLPPLLKKVALEEAAKLSTDSGFRREVSDAIREGYLAGLRAKAESTARRTPVTEIRRQLELGDGDQ